MHGHRFWLAASLLAALAAAGCSSGAAGKAAASGQSMSPGEPTSPASPAAARPAACRTSQLEIAVVKSGVATGNVGATIGFTNIGGAPCTITGWPTLVAVTGAGRRVTVRHALTTFFGPPNLSAPPVVTLQPGQRAEAQLAGIDFPLHGSSCPPSYRSLLVKPPGGGQLQKMSAWIYGLGHYLPACGPISVSPVVPPSDLV